MPEAPPTRRRWFQLSLAELVVLVPLFVAIWWSAAVRPKYVEWLASEPEGQFVRHEWREPHRGEIADRGLTWSAILLVVWFVVRARYAARVPAIVQTTPRPARGYQITMGRMLGAVALLAVSMALIRIAVHSETLGVLFSLLAFTTFGLAVGTPFGRPLLGLLGLIVVSFLVFAICITAYMVALILSSYGIIPAVQGPD